MIPKHDDIVAGTNALPGHESIVDRLKQLFSSKDTYQAAPEPIVAPEVTPEPGNVIKYKGKSLYEPGTYEPVIRRVSQETGVDPAWLAAVGMQESSFGKNTKNKVKDWQYLVGGESKTIDDYKNKATEPRYADAKNLGFSDPYSALRSAAIIAKFKANNYDAQGNVMSTTSDPTEMYKRYNGGGSAAGVANFPVLHEFYKNYFHSKKDDTIEEGN